MSLLPRVTEAQIGPNALTDLHIWLGFQFVADQFLLPILFLTLIFAKSVRRHYTLVNFVFTWIIAGVVSSLLFYNQTYIGPEPSPTYCTLQAATLEAVPPMTSVAVFLVIFSVWRGISRSQAVEKHRSTGLFYLVLILPYIAWIGFSVVGVLIGASNPSLVSRDRRFFYCSIDLDYYSNTQSIFTAVVIVLALIMEVHIAVILGRNWRALSKSKGSVAGMDVSTVIRVLLFGVYLLSSLLASVSSALDEQSVVPDMFSATIGAAVFLVFGLQRDILRAWCFWLPKKPVTRDAATFSATNSATSTKVDPEAYPSYPAKGYPAYGTTKGYPALDEVEPYPYNIAASRGTSITEGKDTDDFEPFPYNGPRTYSPDGNRPGARDAEKGSISDAASLYSHATTARPPLAMPRPSVPMPMPLTMPQVRQTSMLPSPHSPPRMTFPDATPAVSMPIPAAPAPVRRASPNQAQGYNAGMGGRQQPTRQESYDSQTNSSIYSQSTAMHPGGPPPSRPYRPGNLDLGNIYEQNRR